MKIAITGAAGFIGSNLTDYLLTQGHEILGLDNLSTGQREFLALALKNKSFRLAELDLLDFEKTRSALAEFKPEIVFHLSANADIRHGLRHPRRDLEQGTLVTFNVLESARLAGARQVAYSSTGSVYGEAKVIPTSEDCPFPVQTSLYAASKLAGEGLVEAYAEGYGLQSFVFRFVSILGERYTHGHVFDFAKKILANPEEIEVLGNGQQKKSYLYVGDCVAGMWHLMSHSKDRVNIFNLGCNEYVTVDQSLDVICKTMGVSPKRKYTGGERGWVGDSPFIFLETAKARKEGFAPKKTVRESVELTLRYILENKWLLERRD